MDFFEVIEKRRSIRKFTDETVPEAIMRRAFDAAVLAPNSSNTQTWNFYWIRNADKKKRMAELCMSQSAARTAQELVAITAAPSYWKRSLPGLIRFIESVHAPSPVQQYYRKLIPFIYRGGLFAPIKWLLAWAVIGVRPSQRIPATRRDLQEVAIKSAALAAENFVLALTAQGFDTCMMEGFDEWRVKRLLRLRRDERVLMIVGIGKEGPRATWGPRFRISTSEVVHEV